MPDLTLGEILALLGLAASGAPPLRIRGVATLEAAGAEHLAFAESHRYLERVRASRAGAVLVPEDFPALESPYLARVAHPRRAFLRVAERFVPAPAPAGIHPQASIHPDAWLGEGVMVEACAVVAAGARLGPGCRIGPGAYVGEGVSLGPDCRIGPHASLMPGTRLGARVIVHAGGTLGGEGFGYVWLEDHHHKVPQLGGLVIEDDVEIGCNSCLDRGALGDTRVGRGTKIDNLVQVGHNCDLGEHVLLVSQVGLSGSVSLGAGAVLGGQAGVADHLRIGPGARVGAAAGVTRDLEPGETVLGMPPRSIRAFWREQALLQRLPVLVKQLQDQERRIRELEERLARLDGAAPGSGPGSGSDRTPSREASDA